MILKRKKYSYPDMLTLSFRTSPFYSIIFALRQVIDALFPTATIFVTAFFIDTSIAIFNGYAVMEDIYLPIALIIALMLYNVLSGAIMSLVDEYRKIYYREKIVPEMLEYRASLAYRHIEDQESHDIIWRVFPYVENTVWSMYTQILQVLSLVIFIMGIVITLFTQVWWIAITMVVASVPVMYIGKKAGEEKYQADRDITDIRRKYWHLGWILCNRDNVEERTVYGYGKDINEKYFERFEYARKYTLKVDVKNFIRQKIGGLVTSLYAIGVIFVLLPQAYTGVISIGMFIGLIGAIINLSGRLSWEVNFFMEQLTRSREWLKDLTTFMAFDIQEGATDTPVAMDFKLIQFKNVSFSYPGTEKQILKGVSFTIEKGKHYSFVGENGAGKTTITKLITGMYTNYEGEILVDGKNLKTLTHAQLKGLTSVVYQDFARFQITMYDNIAIGNINDMNNRKKAEEAIQLVDLGETVDNLKDGLDTYLGKVYENGVDISGGQWQRTATARSVVNPAPLKILDEPTSALDPIAESEIYKNFEKITKGETTIFISHRLGSTKLADVIFVLDDGRIIEEGSHDELVGQNGLYSHMYTTQAQWYVEVAG